MTSMSQQYNNIPTNYIGVVAIVDQIVNASDGSNPLPIWNFQPGRGHVVNISNFRDTVARTTDSIIEVRRPPKDTPSLPSVTGFHTQQEDKHIIGISRLCNHCWFRFSAAKELFHVLCPEPDRNGADDVVHDAHAQMDNRHSLIQDIAQPFDIEVFCYFAAIELMIPRTLRDPLISLRNKGLTFYDLAKFLHCPEYILKSEMFNRTTGLRQISDEAWHAYKSRTE